MHIVVAGAFGGLDHAGLHLARPVAGRNRRVAATGALRYPSRHDQIPISPMQFSSADPPRGPWARWTAVPLYLRILGALALGIAVGVALGEQAGALATPAKLILRLLSALAPPLILFAIVRALVTAELPPGTAPRLAGLLLLNTTVAIAIGLAVANLVQPGAWHEVGPTPPAATTTDKPGPLAQFVDNIPRSLLGPLTDGGSVISVIFLALAFGVALRHLRHRRALRPNRQHDPELLLVAPDPECHHASKAPHKTRR